MNAILDVLWNIVEGIIDTGIKLLGNVLLGFSAIALKLVNAAIQFDTKGAKHLSGVSKEGLYASICHAFNSVFWFSKNVLLPFGIFILTVVLIWNLSKILMSGQKGTKDDPVALVRRTIIAGIFIFVSPYLICFALGTPINTNIHDANKVVSMTKGSGYVMPTLLKGLSAFDGVGKNGNTDGYLHLSKKDITALTNQTDTGTGEFEYTKINGDILINGIKELGISNVDPSELGLGTGSSKTSEDDNNGSVVVGDNYNSFTKNELIAKCNSLGISTEKKKTTKDGKVVKDKKTKKAVMVTCTKKELQDKLAKETGGYAYTTPDDNVLDALSQSMYQQYSNSGWAKGIVWRIIYIVIFIVQPAMIIWNLVQMIWVFVKRVVSLILSSCLAPLAIAFYPSQSTTEVTTKWIKMSLGYGLTTVLTFAFVKLGAFIYASTITIQYTERSLILTIVLNFACLAVLGFVKEMESYANNLGANLVGFKNGISGQLGKLLSNWGQKLMLAPYGVAKTGLSLATKQLGRVPGAVGFMAGKQGFFKSWGQRNLDKTRDARAEKAVNKANKKASKVLKNDTKATASAMDNAQQSIDAYKGHATLDGKSWLSAKEIQNSSNKQPVSPVTKDNANNLATNKNGKYWVDNAGNGIPKEVMQAGKLNKNNVLQPAPQHRNLFPASGKDGVTLKGSKNQPDAILDNNGTHTSLTTSSGNNHIVSNKTRFDEALANNKIPNDIKFNSNSVITQLGDTKIISNGDSATIIKDIKTPKEFESFQGPSRKEYEAFLDNTTGDVRYAKAGGSLSREKLK